MKRQQIIIIFILLLNSGLHADLATKQFQFLRFSASPRANALADTYTSLGEDVNNIYYNPAGVYSVYPMDISLHYINLYESMNFISAAVKYKVHKLGDIGLGLNGLLYGKISRINMENGVLVQSSESISPVNYQAVLNYSRLLLYRWIAGINVKMVHEKLDQYQKTIPNIDIGTIYRFNDNLNIGAAGRNLLDQGNPLMVNLGLSYTFFFPRIFMDKVLLSTDIEKIAAVNDMNYGVGIEFCFFKILNIRGGYRIGNNIDDAIRFGGGINYKGISLDYSYLMHNELDAVSYIGIKYRMGHEIFTIEKEKKEELIRLSEDSILIFEFNKTDISLDGKQVLNEIARYIKSTGYDYITINGYSDNIGGKRHNLNLSNKRAQAVYDFFIEEGLNSKKMKYQGYGSKNPIADNDTEEGRSKNRRCEIIVSRSIKD